MTVTSSEMDDAQRGDLCTIRRRLDRRGCHVTPTEIETTYGRALEDGSRGMRIRLRRGPPMFRSAAPWRVEQRRFGIWRTQGLHGSREGFATRDLAQWFHDLCVRVDARDAAERRILRKHGYA